MEEQKNSKVVKMQSIAGSEQGNNKQPELNKEQLQDIADKLFNENRWLKQQLHQAHEFANTINRLDYLFKVVSLYDSQKSVTFSVPFVEECIQEIEKVLTPEENKPAEDNKEN